MKILKDRKLLKNSLSVSFLLILTSFFGFFAQITLVSIFGASIEMDIYFKLLAVPTIITGIIPIIISSVLIPNLAKFKSDYAKMNKFIYSLWIIIIIVSILFVLIGFFNVLINIDLFIPPSAIYLKEIGVQVTLMVWIGCGFSIMSSYLSSILHYNNQFIKVAFTALLPACIIIILVLLFHKQLGIRSISLGFCIAFILQFAILLKASKIKTNFFSFSFKHIPNKILLLKQSSLVFFSMLPFTVLVPIAYYWASKLEDGSISYLAYSQNFAGFLSVAVGMGISIVTLPDLADKFANGKGESSLHNFEIKLRYVLLIAIFAAGAFIALRIPILTQFFERGSFNSESVNNLAMVLPWYLVAGVFSAALNLLRTLFFSKQEFKIIAFIGLIMPILFFMLAGILIDYFSYIGIGMANALTFGVFFLTIVYFSKNKKELFLTNNFVIFNLKIIFITMISSYITSKGFDLFSNSLSQLISIFISLFVFLITYFLLSKFLFKIKEIEKVELFILIKMKFLNKL